jgi:hypothetical protein
MAKQAANVQATANEAKAATSKYRRNYADIDIDDVRDKRIVVLKRDFKRGKSAKRYAEMVAFVEHAKDKATFGDVLESTSYRWDDVRWDIARDHIRIADTPQVELQRALFVEGELSERVIQVRSRSGSVREFCIEKHGSRCLVCKLDFGERFGEVFADLIEVHHKNPLAQRDGDAITDPEKECVPLCPNCHRMAHHGMPPGTCRSLHELVELLARSERTVVS